MINQVLLGCRILGFHSSTENCIKTEIPFRHVATEQGYRIVANYEITNMQALEAVLHISRT